MSVPADPPFADFKAEILGQAHEDLMGVYEAWWTANAWYPAAVLRDWATWAIPEGPRVFFISPEE